MQVPVLSGSEKGSSTHVNVYGNSELDIHFGFDNHITAMKSVQRTGLKILLSVVNK